MSLTAHETLRSVFHQRTTFVDPRYKEQEYSIWYLNKKGKECIEKVWGTDRTNARIRFENNMKDKFSKILRVV